jgi:D-serine deaminase-like pyridoxal phosphate-dependent protein
MDLDAFNHNVGTMATWAKGAHVSLRPHAKSHKSAEIARRIIAEGAIGSSCATIDEAELLAAGGIRGILITSPMAAHHMCAEAAT